MKTTLVVCLILTLLCLPCPGTSTDIVVKQGDTFDFRCILGASADQYLQVFKESITFLGYGGFSTSSPGETGKPGDRQLRFLLSTNSALNTDLPASMASRYSINGGIMQVTDAQPGDSGMWTCRVVSENTTSLDGVTSLTMTPINITVISPVLAMRMIHANYNGLPGNLWIDDIEYIDDRVTLNKEDNKYFGCQVWFNMGLPSLSGHWQHGDEAEEIDRSQWLITTAGHTAHLSGFIISANSSAVLYSTTQAIPNVGKHNGHAFVCTATLPLIGDENITISIKSTTAIEAEDEDGDDEDDPISGVREHTVTSLLISLLLPMCFLLVFQ